MYSEVMLHGGKIAVYPLPIYDYRMHSSGSIYYTSNTDGHYWGRYKILMAYCQELKIVPSLCSVLQMLDFEYNH
jgi:hypothetical protein